MKNEMRIDSLLSFPPFSYLSYLSLNQYGSTIFQYVSGIDRRKGDRDFKNAFC